MELWIRSQDKLKLVKVNYVYVIENKINSFSIYGETIDSGPIIGRYETKERALEVLDEIENYIEKQGTMEIDLQNGGKYYGKVYEMPKE